MDVDGLIKALQLIASETDLDKLQIAMVELLLANSDADRIVLLLKENDNWSVHALEGILTKNKSPLVKQILNLENIIDDLIPEIVFNYSLRSKEALVSENAMLDERFSKDNLIQSNKIKSIACIPIMSQGELRTIVYLENQKHENVFNPERMVIIKHLSSQFGISVENALLYEKLNQKILNQSENEQKLRIIFEHTNDTITVTQDQKVIYCNPQIEKLTGFSTAEIRSHNFLEFIHPDDQEIVMNEYRERLSGEQPKNSYSVRIITKNSQEKHVFVSSTLINWDGGSATLAIVTDITKLKRVESDLKRSEEHFRNLLEQSPLPIEILTSTGKITQVNSAWKKLWKVSDDEAKETIDKYNMLTDPQLEKLGIMNQVKEAFKGKHTILPPIQYDTAQTIDDFDIGKLKKLRSPWIQCHLNAVKDDEGNIIYIVNTYVDITDFKKVEETLSKSEARYRHLIDSSPLSTAILTPDGKICQVNAAWKNHWGLTEEEAIQLMENYNILTDKQIKNSGHATLVEKAFKGESVILPLMEYKGNNTIKELELEDITAQLRWIQTHLYPVKKKNGELDYVVSINMDSTKLKKAEGESNRQNNILARISRSRRMGQLTGSIAHELNQPLTGILSNAQAAELMLNNKHWGEAEFKEILTEIISDTKRASDLIRNLRRLYQNEKIDFSPIKINNVIIEVTKMLHSEMIMKNIDLTTKFASSLPIIKGNNVQIQQIMVNLILNGVQSMDYKEREDRKLLITTSYNTYDVKVFVEDNGKGINLDIIDRIFEPLATWKPDGTGMGLAISNTIVGAHGGKMFAENIINGGAQVGFSIPIIKEKA